MEFCDMDYIHANHEDPIKIEGISELQQDDVVGDEQDHS